MRAIPRASSSWGRGDEVVQGGCDQARANGHRRAAQPRVLRVGPWHKLKADNAGNAYDGVTRSLLTKRPAADFGGMCAVEVKGHAYELANVSADGDTTVLTVKGFKPWVL